MRIEILYFDGWQGHEDLIARLPKLIEQAGLTATITWRRIDNIAMAERERFLGSPSIRIDGDDIDSEAHARSDFGMRCRLYPDSGGRSGRVPDDVIIAALERSAPAPESDPYAA